MSMPAWFANPALQRHVRQGSNKAWGVHTDAIPTGHSSCSQLLVPHMLLGPRLVYATLPTGKALVFQPVHLAELVEDVSTLTDYHITN